MVIPRYTIYKNITIEQLNIYALFVVVFLAIVYLFLANDVAMTNYNKSILQKRIGEIITDIRNLNLELADKRSIGFLEKSAKNLNMVVNESIQYIKIAGPVAKNP